LSSSLLETGNMAAMTFVILAGALLLGYFVAITNIPSQLAALIAGAEVNRYFILTGIIVIYLILGCVMSGMAMITITVPVFLPVIVALGFDPIWFGIMIVIMCELAAITPPVGINIFVIKRWLKRFPLTLFSRV